MASAARRFINWAAAFEDGAIIRAAFFGLLSATAVILYLDYTEMSGQQPLALPPELLPILPAFDPIGAGRQRPGPAVTTPMETLRQPLEVKLTSGGVLNVTGTILPGSAEAFATAGRVLCANTSRSVALDLARRLGHRCARDGQADPRERLCHLGRRGRALRLVLPAGVCRRQGAARGAGLGHRRAPDLCRDAQRHVHVASRLAAAGNAMSDAQTMTAEISRYLIEMGIDPEVWLRALETPPDRLSYFSPDDLIRLKLATRLSE